MTPAPHPKPNIIQALGLVSRYSILIGKMCIPDTSVLAIDYWLKLY